MSIDTHAWVCQQIVDQAQDAMIFADGDGVIRLWNVGAEAMFGYRAEEAVGRTLDLIIPAPLRARHWAGYREVMATGVTPCQRGAKTARACPWNSPSSCCAMPPATYWAQLPSSATSRRGGNATKP